MVYIFVAFYAEAKNIIEHYELKLAPKEAGVRFDVFSNEKIRLVITGVGAINAATAVGNIGGASAIGESDIIVNIGSCAMQPDTVSNGACEAKCDTDAAAEKNKCGIYLGNKITEQSTGRTFYPDMLLKSNLEERGIITVPKPVSAEFPPQKVWRNEVYDMEAAAIYQAASYFVGPHRQHFIKVVSDSGEQIDRKRIESVFAQAEAGISEYIDMLLAMETANTNQQYISYTDNLLNTENTKKKLDKLHTDMRCSKVMGDQLRQLIKYCSLSKIDYNKVIDEYYASGKLPCNSKKAGKQCLDELKKSLLQV